MIDGACKTDIGEPLQDMVGLSYGGHAFRIIDHQKGNSVRVEVLVDSSQVVVDRLRYMAVLRASVAGCLPSCQADF